MWFNWRYLFGQADDSCFCLIFLRDLEQKPSAFFGLVGPVVEQAIGSIVTGLSRQLLGFAERFDQLQIIRTQFLQHVRCLHLRLIIVGNGLPLGDIADGCKSPVAVLADPFCDQVRGREYLCRMFVEHKMIVAEMRTGNVPVEVFGLEIESKTVRQYSVQRFGYRLFALSPVVIIILLLGLISL